MKKEPPKEHQVKKLLVKKEQVKRLPLKNPKLKPKPSLKPKLKQRQRKINLLIKIPAMVKKPPVLLGAFFVVDSIHLDCNTNELNIKASND